MDLCASLAVLILSRVELTIVATFKYGLVPFVSDQTLVQSAVFDIIKTAKENLKKDFSKIKVLDVGSGHGEQAVELSKHFDSVVGVEPQEEAYAWAKKQAEGIKNVTFVNKRIEDFETRDKYDLIVLLTVFEHLSDQKEAFLKIFSLLAEDGVIYLTVPNKFWIFEQHYGLPFLAWLPLPLANLYLKLAKGVDSYEDSSYSMSYGQIKRFFDQFTCNYKFALPYDVNGAYIGCGNQSPLFRSLKNLGVRLIKLNPLFWYISKGFIMVISKKPVKTLDHLV